MLILALTGGRSAADTLRLAVFAAPLSRDGPGLLLRDLREQEAGAMAAAAIVRHLRPDILLLTDFDYDREGAALGLFAEAAGGYAHRFALPSNAGLPTGLDMDGDGRRGGPRDAQGYGRFEGDGGVALLSRWPVDRSGVQDFTGLLWQDLPGAVPPVRPEDPDKPFPSEEAFAAQRLSSTGHWSVPVETPGGTLTLLVHGATPPVFDGPEDRNGLRNRDELRLWTRHLDGALGDPPLGTFVLMANTNLDPEDGDGIGAAMARVLADPRLKDPRPSSAGAQAAGTAAGTPGHRGDPALDTADWPEEGAGNLRVSYVLPSADLRVQDAGVFWPPAGSPEAEFLGLEGMAAGPHRLVWVDLDR